MSATDAVVQLFTINSISQVMMLLAVSVNTGVAMYTMIYNVFFYGDSTPLEQDLRGYFLLLVVSTFALHTVLYFIYKLHDAIPVLVKDDYKALQDTNGEDQSDEDNEQELWTYVQPNGSTGNHMYILCSRGDLGKNSTEERDVLSVNETLNMFNEYSKLIPKPSKDDVKNSDTQFKKDAQENTNEPNDKRGRTVLHQDDDKWKNIKLMLGSYKFHLLFWPALSITCLRIVCVMNLETFLMSFQIDQYPQIIFYISPVISIAMKLSMSVVFHLFSNRVPRVGLVTGGAFLSMGSFILALYQMQSINVILLLVILWTLAGGLTLSLLPAIFASQFGKETSPVSLGAIHAGKATLQLALQGLFGSLYDIQITDGGKTCYGADCFNIFFLTSVILSVVCLILLTCYMYLHGRATSGES